MRHLQPTERPPTERPPQPTERPPQPTERPPQNTQNTAERPPQPTERPPQNTEVFPPTPIFPISILPCSLLPYLPIPYFFNYIYSSYPRTSSLGMRCTQVFSLLSLFTHFPLSIRKFHPPTHISVRFIPKNT